MAITIDHVLLPAHDHEESARQFARIMGRSYDGPDRHFAPVRINESFAVVFMHSNAPCGIHLGFHIGEAEFTTILTNLQASGHPYGNEPHDPANGRTDHPFGGQGLFFTDANGHLFEVMTQTL